MTKKLICSQCGEEVSMPPFEPGDVCAFCDGVFVSTRITVKKTLREQIESGSGTEKEKEFLLKRLPR